MIVFSQFQNLAGDVSPLMAERHFRQIRQVSIRDYGVTPNVLVEHCDDRYIISRVAPLPNRQAFMQFLSFFQAEAISVEADDLTVLVSDRIIRASMQQGWGSIAADLDKLQPSELYDAIESAAVKVFNQPTGPQYYGELTEQKAAQLKNQNEQSTLAQMAQLGIRDPLEKWNRIDAQRQKEAAEIQAREDRAVDGFMAEQEAPPAEEYSFSGFPINPQQEEF
jgi:hypothetical protein